MKNLLEIRRELHQIPELGFKEFKTHAYLMEQIQSLPQDRLTVVTWKTGIAVKVEGLKPSQTIGWRTDIDGLPIKEETGLAFASLHDGKMHACGHDIHMTVALGLLQRMVEKPIDHHVVFLFQPAEEGPGGALPMREWLKREHPDLLPDQIYAFHVAPEYPVGTIATRPGILFANTGEFNVDLIGKEGHAAYPHQSRDMSVAAATLLLQLQTIVSRSVNPLDSAVVTVGKLMSGTAENIISGHARMEGTIRTFNADTMAAVKERIEAIGKGIESSFDCEVRVTYGSSYYQVVNDLELTTSFLKYAEERRDADVVVCEPAMTGEDFGFFLQEIPGFLFWAGVSSPYGLHHAKMNPDEEVIDFMVLFVEGYFRSI